MVSAILRQSSSYLWHAFDIPYPHWNQRLPIAKLRKTSFSWSAYEYDTDFLNMGSLAVYFLRTLINLYLVDSELLFEGNVCSDFWAMEENQGQMMFSVRTCFWKRFCSILGLQIH